MTALLDTTTVRATAILRIQSLLMEEEEHQVEKESKGQVVEEEE
jgi:hypothetical protein